MDHVCDPKRYSKPQKVRFPCLAFVACLARCGLVPYLRGVRVTSPEHALVKP